MTSVPRWRLTAAAVFGLSAAAFGGTGCAPSEPTPSTASQSWSDGPGEATQSAAVSGPAGPDRIAFTRWLTPGRGQPRLWTGNIDGTDLRPVGDQGAFFPAWSPDRTRLIFDYYAPDGSNQIGTIRPDGTGFAQLTFTANNEAAEFSPDGTLIAFDRYHVPEEDPDFATELWVMNADGSDQRPLMAEGEGGFDYEPEFSPDGTQIVFTRYDPAADVAAAYVVSSDGAGARQATPWVTYVEHPRWSPDGATIIYNVEYISDLDDPRNGIWTVPTAGGEPAVVLATSASLHPFKPDYSADGTRILFSALIREEGVEDLHVMDADGTDVARITDEGTFLNHPVWD